MGPLKSLLTGDPELQVYIVSNSSITAAQEILTSSADFTSLDAFRVIDVNYFGYITVERYFRINIVVYLTS